MSGQMFFATTAHVANDWLAVALFVLLAASGASVLEKPTLRRGLATSALLAAALLTKASMLAAAPWAVLVVMVKLKWRQGAIALLPLLAAVPWYIRNVVVYGNLSGMHEFASRGGSTPVLAAAPLVPWFEAAWHMARSAVWTGNNSFTPMSRDIVAFFLLLGVVGFLSALLQDWQQRLPRTEGLVWPLAGLMVASLGYAITVSFWFTQGTSFSAGAWYAQPLALLVSVLFCGAFSRARGLGRVSMIAAALVSAYLLALTWWVKLMPLYAGLQSGRNTFDGTVALYRDKGAELASRLSETAMIPAVPIFVMAAASTVLGVALAARIVWINKRP
jgi:hypothetical protein